MTQGNPKTGKGNFILASALMLSVLAAGIYALTSDERSALESELNQLTSELNDSGYSWLVDYNVSYPYVEVYRENDNASLAVFENISEENWYKVYLTNLSENESYDVFDLRVNGAVEFDYIVDPSLTFMSGTVLVTLNSPQNNSNFNASSVTFNVTGNDTLSWCGVSINSSANVTMDNTTSTAFNYTNTSIADGSYNFIISCNDTSNNYGNSGLNYFLIDTVIPTLNVTSPVNASTYNNNSVLFNVSSSEEGTGSIIPDIDNSLVSWWRMDDVNASGDVVDYLGRNNGSKQGNAVQTDAGKLGKGFEFDGSGDYVDVSGNVSGTLQNFTLSAWIKIKGDGPGTIPGIVDYSSTDYNSGGMIIYSEADDTLRMYVKDVSWQIAISNSVSNNVWYHVVGVADNKTVRIYINGIQDGTTDSYGTIVYAGTRTLLIGRYAPINNEYFNGTIDDVMIFNRSLSADEILSLYNATKLQHTETLDDGSHTFKAWTQDLAGNMNNSGVIGFTTDTVYPIINITYPINGTTYSNYVTELNYTISDTNAQSCWFGNGSINYTAVTAGVNWTNINISTKGSNTWTLWCNDTANNINSSSVTFTVDNTIPTLNVTSPVNSSTYNNNSVLFNVSSSEEGTGSIIPDIDNSLVSWWRMDDLNATTGVIDYMGRNNGTRVNAVQTDAGKLGKGMSFDGDGDVIGINDFFNSSKSFSVSVWAYLLGTNPEVTYTLVSQSAQNVGNDWGLALSPTTLRIGPAAWYATINSAIGSTNKWRHYVLVFNGTNVSGYVDGSHIDTKGMSINNLAYNVNIGCEGNKDNGNGCDYRQFNGTIDDVMIFNRSLSADEILSLYNATKLQHTENLNDGSHTFKAYTQDLAGNMNNSGVISFTTDTTYPIINITYPINGTTYSNYVTELNYTITDTNAQSCWFGNGSYNYSSVTAGTNWTNINISTKGSNTWSVYCNDSANNINSTNVTFSVDNTNPTLNVTSPINNSNYNNNSVLFNVSSSEEGTGSIIPDIDNSLVSWWRMDDVNGSGDPTDYMHCYDNETRVMTALGWKYFKDVGFEDEIATLNNEKGKVEYHKPFEIQNFAHNGEMYRIEVEKADGESGDLLVSPEHKVYVGVDESSSTNSLSENNLKTLPLNSFSEDNNLDIIAFCDSKSLAGTLNNHIPKCSEEINLSSMKCWSRVINSLCSDKASLKISPLSILLGHNLTSCPNSVRKVDKPLCTFSSNKNFILSRDGNHKVSLSDFCSEVQSSFNMFFVQGGVCFKDFFSSSSIFKHFQNYGNHDSCAFESWLSMTDVAINDNELINFDSHSIRDNDKLFKFFYSKDLSGFKLQKISEIYDNLEKNALENKQLVFLDEAGNEIKIKSIKKEQYSGKIYDVDVPNDIILVERNGLVVWSGNSNNGTAYGNATQTDAGKLGKGMSFDGVNDKVNLKNSTSLQLTGPMTISLWALWKSSVQYNTPLIAKWSDDYTAYTISGNYPASGRCQFAIHVSSSFYRATSSNTYYDGAWHQVVGVFNGSNVLLYMDGGKEVVVGDATTGPIVNTIDNVIIGTYSTPTPASTQYFNGTIDDVMIFNRSLSADEILSIYNATKYQHTQSGLNDGSHTFKAYTQDLAGNMNDSGVISFTIDTVYPIINITYPINGTTYSNYVTELNYTISDTNAQSCWFGNGSYNYTSVTAGTNWTNINISAKGSNTWTLWCNDTANNINSSSVIFSVDNTIPTLNVTSPVNNSNYNNNSVLFNVSSSEEGTGSIIPDIDSSLVSWWRMDDVNQTGEGALVVDYKGCYDNETEILTENGWKYFYELEEGEKVATLNNNSGELEWQMPDSYQIFDNGDDDMYKIELEDGSNLLVSEKHRVYSKSLDFRCSVNSSVLNTLNPEIFLNSLSLDQIESFSLIAKAKKSISPAYCQYSSLDKFLANLRASPRKSLYSLIGTKSINKSNPDMINLSSSMDIFALLISSLEHFSSSNLAKSGALSCNDSEDIIFLVNESLLKKENKTLVSTIIYTSPLSSLNLPLRALTDNLSISSSVSSEFSNILSSFFSNSALLTFSDRNFLVASDQFISGSSSNLCLSSAGTDNVMFGILIPPETESSPVYPVKAVNTYKPFGLRPIAEVYDEINDGKEAYFLNALNEPVKVLSITKEDYNGKIYDVDVENDVVLVRRAAGNEELAGNGKKLNEKNDSKVTSFSRKAGDEFFKENEGNLALQGLGRGNSDENEAGVYDAIDWRFIDGNWEKEVDLSGAFWSGNSNNGTAYGNAVQTDAGKLGKGMSFDGNGDYVSLGGVIQRVANEPVSVSGWINPSVTLNSGSSRKDMIAKANNYWIIYGLPSGKLGFYLGYNGLYPSSYTVNLNTNTWYHVVGVKNASDYTWLYLNGVLVGENNSAGDPYTSPNQDLRIGMSVNGNPFNGTIDDVMIFNRSLSADEILSLYNATKLQHTQTGLNEGAHTFKAYTQDLAGNMNASDLISFTTDTTYPIINITYPINGTTYSNYVTNLNYTIDSGSYCWFGNGSYNYTSVTAGTNWTNINISAKGSNTWTVYCNDTANNINSTSVIFSVDNTIPTLNVTSPINNSNYNNNSVLFNVSSSEEGTGSIIPDIDNSLVSWWRMDDTNGSANSVVDYKGCYDNETEILTENGWKLFKDLEDNERVMTLNNETGEKEWQLPDSYQIFDNGDDDMYKIELADGSELVVSEEHKVYAKSKESLKSFVLNTLTEDCFLNNGSLDQIADCLDNANANTGISLSWISCLASGSNDLESSSGMITSIFFNSSNTKSICSNVSLEYFDIEDLMFNSSLQQCSGEYNFSPRNSELIIMNLTGLSLKKDSSILVSTTNSIYQPSFFNFSQAFCFTLSPNLKQSSSVNSEFSSILSSFLSNKALLTLSAKNCLIDSERFSSGNSSICFFNSSGIDKVIFGIFEPPNLISVYSVKDVELFKSFYSENLSNFKLQKITETYENFNEGKEIYFLNSDNNPVRVNSISKEKYDGKIYDVDVENDIVLVRRKNSSEIWSGNSNNGTAVGNAVQTDAGKLGKGMSFDGDGDYIEISNSNLIDLKQDLTVSAWIYFYDITDIQFFISKGSGLVNNYGYEWLIQSNNFRIRVSNYTTSVLNQYGDLSDAWHHAVMVYNGTEVITYVDGANPLSGSLKGDINSSANKFYISTTGTNAVNGTLDDVMIFNRSLSADEILSIYNATKLQHTQSGLNDGSHTFKAYTQDLAGNMNNSGVISFTTDTTYPIINITYPINGTTYTNYVTNLNYTIDSGSYCWFGNGSYNYSSVTAGTNWTNINISTKGSNTWTLWCNDSANNINSSSVIFSVDNTNPTL